MSCDYRDRSDVESDDDDGQASEDANDDVSQFMDSADDTNYDEPMDTFDKDYLTKSTNQTNNYLDPNFLPNTK